MKRPLPNLLVMASLLLAGIALAVGPASAVERSAEQAVKGKAIEFHEISFEIPERGWERFGDQSAPNIQFIHKYGEHPVHRYLGDRDINKKVLFSQKSA